MRFRLPVRKKSSYCDCMVRNRTGAVGCSHHRFRNQMRRRAIDPLGFRPDAEFREEI